MSGRPEPKKCKRYIVDWEEMHRQYQTGPCFICGIATKKADFPADIVYEDDTTIAFLDKFQILYGYTLVCPKEHKEHVTGDFSLEEYLDLQQKLYLISEAVRQEAGAERVYLLTLGSQQGNSHVHWHIAPLPYGVLYKEQQLAIFRRDPLSISEKERIELAAKIRKRIMQLKKDCEIGRSLFHKS